MWGDQMRAHAAVGVLGGLLVIAAVLLPQSIPMPTVSWLAPGLIVAGALILWKAVDDWKVVYRLSGEVRFGDDSSVADNLYRFVSMALGWTVGAVGCFVVALLLAI
jgi:hypothetical protein